MLLYFYLLTLSQVKYISGSKICSRQRNMFSARFGTACGILQNTQGRVIFARVWQAGCNNIQTCLLIQYFIKFKEYFIQFNSRNFYSIQELFIQFKKFLFNSRTFLFNSRTFYSIQALFIQFKNFLFNSRTFYSIQEISIQFKNFFIQFKNFLFNSRHFCSQDLARCFFFVSRQYLPC